LWQFAVEKWLFCQEIPDEIIELRYCLYNIVNLRKYLQVPREIGNVELWS
jgi:hypothetical protein